MNSAFAGHINIVRLLLARATRLNDGLLSSIATKVAILAEDAESGMVRADGAEAWRNFLNPFITERHKQDAGSSA